MKRFALLSATAASLLAFSGADARAQGNSQPAPWTEYGSTLYATGPDVWVKFFGAEAGYTSNLFYLCGISNCQQFLFQNNDPSEAGEEMKLNDTFTVGEQVVFKLYVTDTGDSWYTGSGSSNVDGYPHFATQSINDVTANATYGVLGGFEDLNGGGDQDHNDLMFEFSNVSTSPVTATPEPASIALMATGFVGVGAFARRRKKQAAE